jgi:hypothetical protein
VNIPVNSVVGQMIVTTTVFGIIQSNTSVDQLGADDRPLVRHRPPCRRT